LDTRVCVVTGDVRSDVVEFRCTAVVMWWHSRTMEGICCVGLFNLIMVKEESVKDLVSIVFVSRYYASV